jgi:hypothetical protein
MLSHTPQGILHGADEAARAAFQKRRTPGMIRRQLLGVRSATASDRRTRSVTAAARSVRCLADERGLLDRAIATLPDTQFVQAWA